MTTDNDRIARGVVSQKLIDTMTELIENKRHEIELLEKMQWMYRISYHFDVPLKEIKQPIYRIPTQDEYSIWPKEARDRLAYGDKWSAANSVFPDCEVYNTVKLKDDSIVSGDPLFVTHPPLRRWWNRKAAEQFFKQQSKSNSKFI